MIVLIIGIQQKTLLSPTERNRYLGQAREVNKCADQERSLTREPVREVEVEAKARSVHELLGTLWGWMNPSS